MTSIIRALLFVCLLVMAAHPAHAQWVYEDTMFVAPAPGPLDIFARNVSLSADGTRLLVSAQFATRDGYTRIGEGYVYHKSGDAWVLERIFKPAAPANEVYFGRAAAMSRDARWAVFMLGQHAPGGYIFERVEDEWLLRQQLTGIVTAAESAVFSADGQRFAVGYPSAGNFGTVRVYRFTGTLWSLEATLTPAGSHGPIPEFGWSVSFSADGSVLVAGAPSDTQGGDVAGAVYVFRRTNTAWSQIQRIKASNAMTGASFGRSVSTYGDGDEIVIGAWNHAGEGRAYIFRREGDMYVEAAQFASEHTQAGGLFGSRVLYADDGKTLLVAAAVAPTPVHNRAGRVHVFTRTPEGWTERVMLAASDASGVDPSFEVPAISENGQVAVGAPGRHLPGMQYVGGVYTFDLSGIVVDREAEAPDSRSSLSVYPNPSLGEASVEVVLERPEAVRVVVYDVLGREVRRLHEGTLAGGAQRLSLSGLPAGVYVVRVQAGVWQQARRMVVR
jgi:hypothetical protein